MMPSAGRLPWRRLLMAALGAVAILVTWTHVAERSQREVMSGPSSAVTSAAAAADTATASQARGWGATVGFADPHRLDDHYDKHGAEFGRITRLDYLRQAQLLRDAEVGGPILEAVRHDGVVSRYDRQTGAFIAFNPNGVIRTFFKPNDGERYWRRQAERRE